MAALTAAKAASSRYSMSVCRVWIGVMWALYLVSVGLSLSKYGLTALGLAVTCSATSFGIAIWLLFQPNDRGKLYGGIKLLWDLGVAIVIVCLLLRSGTLLTLLPAILH